MKIKKLNEKIDELFETNEKLTKRLTTKRKPIKRTIGRRNKMLVIIPDIVKNAINEKLNKAFQNLPKAVVERETLYNQLLKIYNNTGSIPDFSLELKEKK